MSLWLASPAWSLALLIHIHPEGRTYSFAWLVCTNYATDKPRERLRKRKKACKRETSARNCTRRLIRVTQVSLLISEFVL